MKRIAVLLCLLALNACDCGKGPPPLTLTDAAGQSREPFKADARKATVLVFLMADCPVCQATSPELARLFTDFSPKGVAFFGVYATETAPEITEYHQSYSLPFPGLLDPEQKLARLAGATIAPQAAVFSPDKQLLYLGRIDDRAVTLGTMRPEPSRRDLRLVLESVMAGKKVEPKFTESVGCYLPEK
jgi:peroxiredoxin